MFCWYIVLSPQIWINQPRVKSRVFSPQSEKMSSPWRCQKLRLAEVLGLAAPSWRPSRCGAETWRPGSESWPRALLDAHRAEQLGVGAAAAREALRGATATLLWGPWWRASCAAEEKVKRLIKTARKQKQCLASQVFQIFSDFFILSLFMEKCLQINTCSHHLRSAIYKSSRQWTCQSGQAKTVLRERLVAVLFLFLVSTR